MKEKEPIKKIVSSRDKTRKNCQNSLFSFSQNQTLATKLLKTSLYRQGGKNIKKSIKYKYKM